MRDDETLEMTSALAVLAARSTTIPRLVRRLAERIAETLALVELELGVGEADVYRSRKRDGWEAVLVDPKPRVRSGAATRPCARVELEGGDGHLALTTEGVELSPAVVRAVARVAEAGVIHCRLLERVAQSARGAHENGSRLRRALHDASTAEDPIAASPAMRALLTQLDAVAGHDATVLLVGETGTGKEVLARRLHRLSGRTGAFVKLNCGALPEGLVESELFGHEPGAFTGAHRVHHGRFERANGGTLLLDEVGELPLAAQVKLLRTLQEQEVERVGGEHAIAVDVRVVAATHRDLAAMVAAGRFREDLYYRLSVIGFAVPPLRQRAEDVAPLARALARRLAERLGVPEPELDARVLGLLARYPWPGNVRQLANALERAMILAPADPGRELELHLNPGVGPGGPQAAAGPTSTGLRELTAELARTQIRAALVECRGRVYGERGAASKLGLKPSTLQDQIRRLGLAADAARARRG